MKVLSGFCGMKHCEGTRPRSPSGIAMKTCMFWDTCSCKCHVSWTQLFADSGRPRTPIENPEYVPYKPDFWMPTPEARAAAAVERARHNLDSDEAPKFNATETGRAAPGELEYRVRVIADEWQDEADAPLLTPKEISERIAKKFEVPPPSHGAIHAILVRWQTIGYCDVGEKPVRYSGRTVRGMKEGLMKLKALAKDKRK